MTSSDGAFGFLLPSQGVKYIVDVSGNLGEMPKGKDLKR
jgi:hypothetical protein